VGSFPLRAAPSAGALYPIELYVVVNNVRYLQQGLYHYSSRRHALDLVKTDDYRARITRCCLHQDFVGRAAVALVMTAIFHRTTDRYGQRGNRYVYMEAGHISQNIYLQAASLGLGSVAVGAFNDEKLNTLLGVDGQEEMAIYVHAVGKRVAELE
jgi:SagB-type dehydrogenase family enzyme